MTWRFLLVSFGFFKQFATKTAKVYLYLYSLTVPGTLVRAKTTSIGNDVQFLFECGVTAEYYPEYRYILYDTCSTIKRVSIKTRETKKKRNLKLTTTVGTVIGIVQTNHQRHEQQ